MTRTPLARFSSEVNAVLAGRSSVSTSQWATTVLAANHAMQGADDAVQAAARLVHPSTSRTDRTSPLVVSLRIAGLQPGSAQWRLGVRTQLWALTCGVAAQQTDPRTRDLASVVAAVLDPTPPPTPLLSAMQQWQRQLVTAGPATQSGRVATALVGAQAHLLMRTREAVERLEFGDAAVRRDRLLQLLDRTSTELMRTRRIWAGEEGVQADLQALRRLAVASRDLSASLRTHVDPRSLLWAVADTGAGGLVAGLTAISQVRQDREVAGVIAAANQLSDALHVLSANSREAVALPTASRSVAAVAVEIQPQAPVMPAVVASASTTDVSTAQATPEELVELANVRDVGIVAAAALDGNPAARSLVEGVPDGKLELLARDGRTAMSRMAASVTDMGWWLARRVPDHDGDRMDVVQSMLVEAMKVAPRWDPIQGASWPTYASHWMRWEVQRYFEAAGQSDQPIEASALEHRLGADDGLTPTEIVEQQLDSAEIRGVIESLPEDWRELVERRANGETWKQLSIDSGHPPARLQEIHDHVAGVLRRRLEPSAAEPPPVEPPPQRGRHL